MAGDAFVFVLQEADEGVGDVVGIVGVEVGGGVSTDFGRLEVLAQVTAVPQAIASITGSPNPSYKLGKTNNSAPAYKPGKSSSETGPRNLIVLVRSSSAASCFVSGYRSSQAPAITNIGGSDNCVMTVFQARMSWGRFLWGLLMPR